MGGVKRKASRVLSVRIFVYGLTAQPHRHHPWRDAYIGGGMWKEVRLVCILCLQTAVIPRVLLNQGQRLCILGTLDSF